MNRDKIPYNEDYHGDPEKLAREKHFQTRLKLRAAIFARFEPSLSSRFDDDKAPQLAAQILAFIPAVKSGWGPMQSDIESVAKDLADGYLAHRDAFAKESFPDPHLAAIEALKAFDFSV